MGILRSRFGPTDRAYGRRDADGWSEAAPRRWRTGAAGGQGPSESSKSPRADAESTRPPSLPDDELLQKLTSSAQGDEGGLQM